MSINRKESTPKKIDVSRLQAEIGSKLSDPGFSEKARLFFQMSKKLPTIIQNAFDNSEFQAKMQDVAPKSIQSTRIGMQKTLFKTKIKQALDATMSSMIGEEMATDLINWLYQQYVDSILHSKSNYKNAISEFKEGCMLVVSTVTISKN